MRARLLLAAVAAALAAPAGAQTIGVAALVRNDVQQVKPSSGPISAGESVVRNEVVRTGSDSSTKLVFSDDTNLAVGPGSTVTLDRFVFAGETSYQKATVNLVRGAFRFTTGGSDKRAYEIKTPLATIGVRGTQFGVLSTPTQTVVTLREGVVVVCARAGGPCMTASTPGQVVVVTAAGIRLLPPGAPGGFDFGQFCGADSGLCEVTTFAALSQSGASFAALCGR